MLKFIPTMATGVRQTFGRFSGLCSPGLNFYVPGIQTINIVANNLQFQSFKLKVKTKDNVFTDVSIGVQLQIKPEDTERAFFSLQNPNQQIETYVQNVVRSKVPSMKLDELFESQGDIGESVRTSLTELMGGYGFTIVDTLVNDISPATEVAQAMNKINASERLKEAAQNEADASYIRKVREAEGDKQRKILNGEGISGQRLAILQGYSTGVESMAHGLGLSSADIVNFVLETQRYDMLSEVGISENTKTIFLDTGSGGPSAVHHVEGLKGVTATDIRNAVRMGNMEAAEASK